MHLVGLHLALLEGVSPQIPARMQRLVAAHSEWPRWDPPADTGPLTVLDVALAGSPQEHMERVRHWAAQLWTAWEARHADLAALLSEHLRQA